MTNPIQYFFLRDNKLFVMEEMPERLPLFIWYAANFNKRAQLEYDKDKADYEQVLQSCKDKAIEVENKDEVLAYIFDGYKHILKNNNVDWLKQNDIIYKLDNYRMVAGSKTVAFISPVEQKEETQEGWILSREKLPYYDGNYYVYGFMHHECGNVVPFHKIVELRMNQWVKSDPGEQMTYWRPLLPPPIIKSNESEY